ncbi:MAG: hypothetical protein Q8M15_12740 [Bacteroidota bacterium]|nr:hypothetical protein [Bacteroidota bacterium]
MRFLLTIAIINTLLVLSQKLVVCKAYAKKNAKTNMLFRIFFSIILIINCLIYNPLSAQPCTGSTPSYTIDLTGNNDSIWTSPNVSRDGNCCATANCIEFNITLDPLSSGIQIDIISGATPGGALDYQVSCGPAQPFGQPVCLSGTGPFRITFCKPGNNPNVYQITSIPKPEINGNLAGSTSCGIYMKATGYEILGLTWTSLPFDSTINNYLSCRNDCDSVSVVPGPAVYPLTLVYQVCGNVIGGCFPAATCDTITLRLSANPVVRITPENPIVCYGSATTVITANPTGGFAPYQFVWNDNDTSRVKSVGVGTYRVTMTDSVGCITARDTVVVTGFSAPFVANAGTDTTICASTTSLNLNGSIQVASGGIWSGGSGTYNPGNTSLNATYSPSAAEINAGGVNLILTTTDNSGCTAVRDTVHFTINPVPAPVISGDTLPCSGRTKSYLVTPVAGSNYLWTVSGGTLSGSNTNNLVNIIWGTAGSGNVTIKQTNSYGCEYTAQRSINILASPGPATLYHY